jgi:hypothetical protein
MHNGGFRVNAKLLKELKKRKQQVQRRIDKSNWSGSSPMIKAPSIKYELAERQQAVSAGGIGVMMQVLEKLDVRREINSAVKLFKLHMPYDEADHVFNIALNILAGGKCLEHLELRRTDEAYLNAVGAQRVPDPTTAGDFCRRFNDMKILHLMTAFNRVRRRVWQQQPDEFLDEAIIEADGTMVETHGEKKQGIGMNYKKQWGYHPLVVTLANTCEPLYVVNRSGSRPSHEQAPFYFDLAISHCRAAGFRKIVLRGDTDFALTENFDRWDADGVKFVFGIDAMPKLENLADCLPTEAWRPLRRRHKQPQPASSRQRPDNAKAAVVAEKGYRNKQLMSESIAEFEYRPGKCSRSYRVVVVKKQIKVTEGQLRLMDEQRYFFYISNFPKSEKSDRQIVFGGNDRCDQENTISQMKSCGALAAPLNDLNSNWAYMVIASLAWSLKAWAALMIKPEGSEKQQETQSKTKRRVLRMEFHTFRQTLIDIPAQIIRRARQLIFRLLSYRESMEPLLLIHASLNQPLRC